MTLREARCLFSANLAKLIDFAIKAGYEVAVGEVCRDARIAGLNAQIGKGIVQSLHIIGLAVDLHLYRGGRYLSETEDHRQLGTFWKSIHSQNRWGGDFHKPDGNHYSLTWEGRA